MTEIALAPELANQFHRLAEESHRSEVDIINEALSSYLAADRRYVAILHRRLAAAERGDFASEDEVAAFFAKDDA